MTAFVAQLIDTLVRGQEEGQYRGTFHWLDSENNRRAWRVWRSGTLARIEEPKGRLLLVAGRRTYWWQPANEVHAIPRLAHHDDFELSRLTRPDPRRYWTEWLNSDLDLVVGSAQTLDHDGREAVHFTAPAAHGGNMALTVDSQLGLVLRAERLDLGVVTESWSELDADTEIPGDVFRYSGPWTPWPQRRYPPDWLPE